MLKTLLLLNVAMFFIPNKSNKLNWTLQKWMLALGAFLSLPMNTFQISLITTQSLFFSTFPMSTALISLTWWISFLMMIASHKSVLLKNKSPKMFSLLLISLNLILTLTFSATSMFWFYIFFEMSLIPTLILILGWGYQPERLQAGMYMILYTVTASLPFLVILLTNTISFNKHILIATQTTAHLNWTYLLILLFSILAFMVKLPVYSVHLWLPKAHVEAPVAGSMILAGILLKLGGFGLIQVMLFYHFSSNILFSFLMPMALWGGMLTSMICMRQTDLKALIAYSSVAHMSFVLASTLTNSMWGWSAAFMMMISHGLVSSSMFCLSNLAYESTQSRSILIPKGMLMMSPALSIWWFLFCTANIPTPPSISLMSEILAIPSIIFFSFSLIPIIVIMGMLSAAYNLLVYTTTQHGMLNKTINPFSTPTKMNHKLLIFHLTPLLLLTLNMTKIIM
uniref:NADH dehydrogenase subunit 4 n=1 Tax=Cellana orientalis TaxID=351212 RepID=UPI002027D62C|nr:NADH dehydrogenase subunit 4 [Cellana orientalis]UPX89390.1 NADH dehydrogenase subunit 4 [Cellana orientalis]